MRILHNIASMYASNALGQTSNAVTKNLQKLSTGLRINSASDDAAGLGVSENLRAQINGTAQAKKNAQDGMSALTIADGAANEITSILQRMRELAVQSSNDTLTSTERGYTNTEVGQLSLEVDRISKVTNFNGQSLLDGAGFGAAASVLQIDAKAGGNNVMTVTIGKMDATTLGVNGLTINTQATASAAITTIDTALNTVNSARATLGAYTNRLEHAINNLDSSNTNQQNAESQIRDVDFASETASFAKNQILTQSATAMLAQANQLPQSVLTLLK